MNTHTVHGWREKGTKEEEREEVGGGREKDRGNKRRGSKPKGAKRRESEEREQESDKKMEGDSEKTRATKIDKETERERERKKEEKEREKKKEKKERKEENCWTKRAKSGKAGESRKK